jgi:hypothetical protein
MYFSPRLRRCDRTESHMRVVLAALVRFSQ